jgi:uncharacterized protein YecT (DUF1311 family)
VARYSDQDMTRSTPHAPTVFLAALALHAPAARGATTADCTSPATQAAMATCAYDEFLAANAQQAQRQRDYVQSLSAADAKRWRASQRAWIAWRTAQCEFLSAHAGSTSQMLRWQCTTLLTRARTTDIERLSQCAEGDIACPPHRP